MSEILYLFIVFILFFLFASSKRYINPKQGKYLIIGSVFIIALCGSLVVPQETYDLSRHYIDIEHIKNANMKFWDYVFNSAKLTDSNYRHTYTFNALRYIISKYLPKQALPFFSLSFCYGVLGYILHDVKKRNNMSNFYIGLVILLSNCFLPILYIYSGIRNEIAFAIMGLAVYLKVYKQIRWITFTVLSAFAATIHPLALAAIPFVFLANIRPGKKSVILVVLIPNILYALMELFKASDVDFLRYIGIKFYNYTFVHVYAQGRYFFYSAIIMTIMVLMLTVMKTKQVEDKDQIFVNYLSWYSIFTLANLQSYQIMMRLPYLFGFLVPAVVNTLFKGKNYVGWRKCIMYLAVVSSIIISVYGIWVNFAWMV